MRRISTLKIFFIAFAFFCLKYTKAQTISTVATGMNMPWSIATDTSGNLFVADYGDHRVWKVDVSNGQIISVAGTGFDGYNGDGDFATNAQLNSPSGVAVDKAGNIYIADAGNNRVRKIDASTGTISTIAGTGSSGYNGDGISATSATLTGPAGVSIDRDGNLYIADPGNHRIRKVAASDGTITTLAGNGNLASGNNVGDGGLATNASLNSPSSIAIDEAGNIYIADLDGNRIRKIVVGTNIITTIAGTGTYGYSGDGATATSATIAAPGGVAVDDKGDVYIADGDNNVIRKINSSDGIINTIAGNGSFGNNGDGGLAVNASIDMPEGVLLYRGAIYVSSAGGGTIRKIDGAYRTLPVKLISFTAENKGQQVLLQWKTTNETNNDHFNVQYSSNGKDWSIIGKVAASVNNEAINTYSFIHSQPSNGINYYRLQQIDRDGKFDYSQIRKITFDHTLSLQVYPNPFVSSFTLNMSEPVTSALTYSLIDMSGRMIQAGAILNQQQTISTNTLHSGIYILKVSNGQALKLEKK